MPDTAVANSKHSTNLGLTGSRLAGNQNEKAFNIIKTFTDFLSFIIIHLITHLSGPSVSVTARCAHRNPISRVSWQFQQTSIPHWKVWQYSHPFPSCRHELTA